MSKRIRLTESDLHRLVNESVTRILEENSRDIDDDNYFGGGLPDRYFDDDAPDNNDYDEHEITQSQIKQLTDAANTIFKIAYNADCETELLKQASQCIRKFVGLYNAGAI